MIKQELLTEINNIITELKFPQVNFTLEQPPQHSQADLATNLVILLAKKSSQKNIAEKIIKKFDQSKLVEKTIYVKPGFLNFHIARQRLDKELDTIIVQGKSYPEVNTGKGRKILLEFVSANPTGPLHIGHGRGASLGDSLARILSQLGYSVETEYYINDVGNQILTLANTVKLRCLQIKGYEISPEEKKWLSEKGYKGEYIDQFAKKILVEHPCGAGAENIDIQTYPFAQKSIEEILKLIKTDLDKFGVRFNRWTSEKSLYENNSVEETVKLLDKANYIYEKEGAVWFKSSSLGDDKDRVIKRKQGYTYFASDVAYHRDKFLRGYHKLINIWGGDHHGYVNRIKSAVKVLGYDENNLKVVIYQLVSLLRKGKPVTMSTRAGEFISLGEVVNEIGIDATRYFLLTRSPDAQLEFDLELAKKHSPENPVYYIQYAHTRCCGIFREAERPVRTRNQKPDIDLCSFKGELSFLKEPEERNLMKKLLFYPEILSSCANNLTVHYLTTYLLQLANSFQKYYDKYRVLTTDKQLTLARLYLIKAIKIVLANGLTLLGISSPQKM